GSGRRGGDPAGAADRRPARCRGLEMRRGWALLLLLALGLPAAGRAPAAPRPKIRPPEARAGDFTVRISQVQRSRTATVTYRAESTAGAQAAGSARAVLQLQLEATGR